MHQLPTYGLKPWPMDKMVASRPLGESKILTDGQDKARRRMYHYEILGKIGRKVYNPVFA